MFSLNYKSIHMRPKTHLLHSLRLSDWKSESFVFFVVYTVRMKLTVKSGHKPIKIHPIWNKKATAHSFYIKHMDS